MSVGDETTAGWRFKANDYKSLLKFRDRTACLMMAFEIAAAQRLNAVTLIHPDGSEEVVTRERYRARFN